MSALALTLKRGPSGPVVVEVASYATDVTFSTSPTGDEALMASLILPRTLAQSLYARSDLYAVLSYYGYPLWRGRVEDPELSIGNQTALTLNGYGDWRALSDVPLTALWSSTKPSDWRPAHTGEAGEPRSEDAYTFVTKDVLRINLVSGTTYPALPANAAACSLTIAVPSGGTGGRLFQRIRFTYNINLPPGWIAVLQAKDDSFANSVDLWSSGGDGTPHSGSQDIIFSATPRARLELVVYNAGGSYAYTGTTGDKYARLSGIRAQTTTSTTITADEVARWIMSTSINPGVLANGAGMLSNPGIDLKDAGWNDVYPADILAGLAAMGDTGGNSWEVGVINGALALRKGGQGRRWLVDVDEVLSLRRSMADIRNSVYAVYQDADGTPRRSSAITNVMSTGRLGLTRRAAVGVSTTDATFAGQVATTALNGSVSSPPRAAIPVRYVYDQRTGGRYPAMLVRSSDVITLRGMPLGGGDAVELARTFAVARTSWTASTGVATIEPLSLPTIAAQLAAKG